MKRKLYSMPNINLFFYELATSSASKSGIKETLSHQPQLFSRGPMYALLPNYCKSKVMIVSHKVRSSSDNLTSYLQETSLKDLQTI